MGRPFFIGDLHLGHKNIMQFGQRSMFDTIEEHDQGIMDRWNAVVTKMTDIVYVLGDVAMSLESLELLRAFNGRKVLVMGNHDHYPTEEYLKYFERVCAFEKKYHGMVFTHIPIHPQEMRFGWKWNVHGHIHALDEGVNDPRYINVNADWINLTPVPLEELRAECEGRLLQYPELADLNYKSWS